MPRKSPVGNKVRKTRPPGSGRGTSTKRAKLDRDYEVGLGVNGDDIGMLDPETGAFVYNDKPTLPSVDDMPYAPEAWPGKVCAFCNLGERSQLGQGEFLRLNCPEGFIPQRMVLYYFYCNRY